MYIDDLKVGDTFQSREYYVSSDEIKEFATKYDPQDFHLNEDLAKETFFEGLAASGWHTVSIAMRLSVETLSVSYGLIGLGATLDWPTATRPNDLLSATFEVVDIRMSKSKPHQGIVTWNVILTNQDGKHRLHYIPKILMFKRNIKD